MSTPNPKPPVALTIAGSDSGGGAGIQADLKTFQAFGVFGASAVTAVTAQNTLGVTAVHVIPAEVVRAQIDAVVTDLHPTAAKAGMLANADLVGLVGQAVAAHRMEAFVLDPVMVATSGDRLLPEDAVASIRTSLLPLAALVTPNLPEAEMLIGRPVHSEEDMVRAARALVDLGAGAALVKGGHLSDDVVVDVLWDGREERRWRRQRVATRHTHGTGCALSAAVTASLARGATLEQAVDAAIRFVAAAIASAPGLGAGRGPLDFGATP